MKNKFKCNICNIKFESYDKNRKYCSRNCVYKSQKGKSTWNKNISMKKLYPHAGFQKGNKLGYISVKKGFKRILNEVNQLEKQGFRVIPIGKVIPDIIAIKDNKVFAVEVEYSRKPDYNKYERNNYSKWFDDIIWILRRKNV